MRALRVVNLDEVVEAFLLLEEVERGGLDGFLFEREMHALVAGRNDLLLLSRIAQPSSLVHVSYVRRDPSKKRCKRPGYEKKRKYDLEPLAETDSCD